jgi:sodium/proline symporter
MDYSPLHVTFAIYILGMVGIGFAAWWFTRSFDDYILGGRSLGSYVTAMSAGASDMSGWLLLGLPGALYAGGIVEAWIAIGLVVGAWANWRYVAAPLRIYTERSDNALTLPDWFTHRFEDRNKLLRIVSASIILLFFAIYCASGIVAGARLFESVFALPYAEAMLWGAGATILYTFVGGFLAVSWTDTVQATLMLFALIVTPVFAILALGGPVEAVAVVEAMDPGKLDFLRGTTLVGVISLLAWGLGYIGQPHILARFMAVEHASKLPAARRISMSWMVLCLLGAMACGFFGIAYFAAHPEYAAPVQANPERVFIQLATVLFNPWVAGILLSAILAAIMSTLSCQLLVCASALTEDFYKGLLRPNAGQTERVWFGRAMVLVVAVLAIWLASNPESSVLRLVSYAWAGFGAAFGPVIVLSLFWRRTTRNGALAGMIVGAVTVVVWKLFYAAPSGLYEMVPAFAAGTLTVVGVSLLGRPSPAMLGLFDHVHGELRRLGL